MSEKWSGPVYLCLLLLTVCIMTFPGIAEAAPGSGTAVIAPLSDVVAGSAGKWAITYTAAEDFSSGSIQLLIPSGWSVPQIGSGLSAGYVTAISEGTLDATPLSVVGRNIRVNIDTLSTGETVTIVYGDDSVSPAGNATAQTAKEDGVIFAVSSDPAGTSVSAIAVSPTLDVIAALVERLVFLTPPRTFKADGESGVMR
ncbi:MAG TPA: hypothetical protein VLA34_00255, partial [Candidatus Krumholzibacterium sp.]|nr:hypothetical protein [Candidatus Krumholzibacterium sp.]